MGKRVEGLGWTPPHAGDFSPYLNRGTVAPLDTQKLDLQCLTADQRGGVKTATTGDFSLILRYRAREGAVSSFEEAEQDLRIVQLQGARQEEYRVTTGMNWVYLFANQALWIATHPESGFDRLVLPLLGAVEGLETATEDAVRRYERFARLAEMRPSDLDRAFVRDVLR